MAHIPFAAHPGSNLASKSRWADAALAKMTSELNRGNIAHACAIARIIANRPDAQSPARSKACKILATFQPDYKLPLPLRYTQTRGPAPQLHDTVHQPGAMSRIRSEDHEDRYRVNAARAARRRTLEATFKLVQVLGMETQMKSGQASGSTTQALDESTPMVK